MIKLAKPKGKSKKPSVLTEAADTAAEEFGWRPLGQAKTYKGLTRMQRDKQLAAVFKLFLENPFAKRILEIQNDYVFGSGFDYDVELTNDAIPIARQGVLKDMASSILEKFWKSSKFDLRLPKKGLDLSLNGMLIMPAFVNKVNGQVRLGFIDPENLISIATDSEDIEDVRLLKLKGAAIGQPDIVKKVIRRNNDFFSPEYEMYEGDYFYFSINNVSNQPEGISDAVQMNDLLQKLDRLLRNMIRYTEMLSYYTVHVKLKNGTTVEKIRAWAKENPVWSEPHRIITSQDDDIILNSLNVNAVQLAEFVRLLKNIALGSQGIPEHWFADGGNTNLATAVSQGTPIMRKLAARQQYVSYMLEEILTFVMQKGMMAAEAAVRPTREEILALSINIIAPEIEQSNMQAAGASFKTLMEGIALIPEDILSQETTKKIVRNFIGEALSYEVSNIEEDAAIAKENDEQAKEDAMKPPPIPPMMNGTTPPVIELVNGNGKAKEEAV